MPRLPTLGPAPIPNAPTRIVTGQEYGAGLVGQGLEKLGGAVESAGNELEQNQTHLQTMQAEGRRTALTEDAIADFERDPDYKTFAPRAQARLDQINSDAASLISNPYAQELFKARALEHGRRAYHQILGRATTLERQDAVDQLEDSTGKIALGIRSAATPDEAASRADELEQAVRTFNPGLVDPNHQRRIIDKYIRGQGGIIGRIADERAYDIAGKGFNAQWDNLKELEAAPSRGTSAAVPQSAGDYLQGRLAPGYESRTSDVQNLHPVMQDRLAAFLKAGQDAGHDISIVSGQRSEARQAVLWNQALQKYGSPQEAARHVAPPGGSSHQSGEAADLQFGDRAAGLGGKTTPAVQWAHDHASEYGLNFPLGNEDWHIEPNEARAGGKRYGGKYDPNGPTYWRGADTGQGSAPTKVAANDNATGGAQPLRWADIYARMDPATLSRKITNARNALHQSVLTEADGAEKVAETTGQIPRDNDGQTVLDHSRVLLPNQQTKVKYKVEGGLNRYNAVAPLSDMTDDEARQHIYQTLDPSKAKMSDGQPLPYAIAAKNQAYADKLYAKIKKQRDDDPAQATMGAPLSVGGAPRISGVDEKGQPTVTDGNDDGDVATHASREVSDALRQIHGKPGDINDPNTDRLAQIQARSKLIDAMLATQERWGIPREDQRIVTKEQAQKIFGTRHLSRIPGDDQSFLDLDQKARERATEWYGAYGARAYRDAAKLLMSSSQRKSASIDLATGLLSGKLSPEDLWVDRSRRYGAPETSPRFAPPQQVTPAPASRGRPGMPPLRSGGASVESAPAQPPGPEFPTPNPGHLTWIQKNADDPDARRFFDSKFGRGAAAREIAKMQGQPQ